MGNSLANGQNQIATVRTKRGGGRLLINSNTGWGFLEEDLQSVSVGKWIERDK